MIALQYGTEAINYGCNIPVPRYSSTGIKCLDTATGGGVPHGAIVDIYGAEATGKTSLALAMAFKRRGPILYIDADHAANRCTVQNIGRKRAGEFYFYRPDTLEEALTVAEIAAGGFPAIVFDSLPALPSKREFRNREIDETELNRYMSTTIARAMPRLATALYKSGGTLFVINQLRQRPGIMYGNQERPTGGRAIGYYSTLRMQLHRTEVVKQPGGNVEGIRIIANVIKAKHTAPGKRAALTLRYGQGFSDTMEEQRKMLEALRKQR